MDDFPYNYDPHGFIVAATQPMQPRAGAVSMQNPLAMSRASLSSGPAYQALMQALVGSFGYRPQHSIASMTQNPALARAISGAPSIYTPQGIPQAQRVNWTPLSPSMPGTVQPMTDAPAMSLLPPGAEGLTE